MGFDWQTFPSSLIKFQWAHHHLDCLKFQIEGFEKSQPAVVTAKFKPQRPGYDMTFHVIKPVPVTISTALGDVIGCLRDSLDHLIYELSIINSGVPPLGLKPAFPICERRSQWPLKPKGRVDKRSGEWKISGLSPQARTRVRWHQPFYRKQGDGPFRKHALWELDELRNIDKHRRLSLATVSGSSARSEISVYNPAIRVVRHYRRRRAPKDGTVIERIWLTPGATQADVSVNTVPTCKVVLNEPTAHQVNVPLIETLENCFVLSVAQTLANFGEFQSPEVQEILKGNPWIEV